jgi:hypothetical protein
MKKLLALSVVLLAITACEDRYRYACQDPVNFDKKECQIPACESDGSCSKYLVPQDAIKEHIEGDKK